MHTQGRGGVIPIFALLTAVFMNFGCSTPPLAQSKNIQFGSSVVKGSEATPVQTLSRADLQDVILRFETEFTARTHDALRPLTQSSSSMIRLHATRANLIYGMTSLDIALGAIPEQNLLDMLTYIELIRDVFRDYWIPHVYEKSGKPVLRAFDQSAKEIQAIAASYLTPNQIAELRSLADAWHTRNPDRIAVETVRLSDFSAEAGAQAKRLQSQISGLFAPISGATAAAFQAILLGERGLYYGLRAPSLLGMQSIVTLQDVFKEITSSAAELSFSLVHVQKLEALLAQSEATLKASEVNLRELSPVIGELRQLTELVNRSPLIFEGGEKLLASLSGIIKEYNRLATPKDTADVNQIIGMTSRIEAGLKRFFQIIFMSGLAIILFSGVVYVLARLTYDHLSKKRAGSAERPEKRKAA